MPKFTDHSGQRYNQLTILRRAPNNALNQTCWHCRCDCGTELVLPTLRFVSGNTKSCGCRKASAVAAATIKRCTTHGKSARGKRSRAYIVWINMIQRCTNPKNDSYSSYGARGIKVSEPWRSFEAFISDMGEPPLEHTLDRIDVNGDYALSNCRWATHREQARNKTNNNRVSYRGKEQTLSDWAIQTGIPLSTLKNRIDYLGWSVEEALSLTPSPLPKGKR